MSHYGEIFDDACRRLRKALPLIYPLRIKTKERVLFKGEEVSSQYIFHRGKFTIEITRGMAVDAAVDALIHEYAHCVHHELNPTAKRAHTKQWGKVHSQVYEAYHGKH